MSKIAMVVDSTALISEKMKNNPDVYVVPLSVIVNDQEYKDLVDLQESDWIRYLKRDATMTTSQPQTSIVVETLNEIKGKNYDEVYILSITSTLSGTLNSFSIGIEMSDIQNVHLIDTFTIAGPVGYMAEAILDMNEQGLSHHEIMDALEDTLQNNEAIISPETLNRLVKSGRMSKATGLVGSILKLKPILKFGHHDEAIEKHEIVRSERKVFDSFIDRLHEKGVNAQDYIIYLLNVEGEKRLELLEEKVAQTFPGIEIRRSMLPGVIATHVGLGTVSLQYVKKVKIVS